MRSYTLEKLPWISQVFQRVAKNPAIGVRIAVPKICGSRFDVKGQALVTITFCQGCIARIYLDADIVAVRLQGLELSRQGAGTAANFNDSF